MSIIPDHSLEAEQGVLGALIIDPESNAETLQALNHSWFKVDEHKEIAVALRHLFNNDQSIDVVSVGDYLESARSGIGMDYVMTVCDEAPGITPYKVSGYVRILQEKQTRREIVKSAQEAIQAAQDIDEIDECVNVAQSGMGKISTGSGYSTENGDQLMSRYSIVVTERMENTDGMLGVTTGFNDIDELTSGLIPGLHIIGGRPKSGKSTLALNICLANMKMKQPCFIASFEMPGIQIADRLVSSLSGVDFSLVQNPVKIHNQSKVDDMARAIQTLAAMPFELIDKDSAHIDKICSSIRQWKRRVTDGAIAMIDYLQLMQFIKADRHDLAVSDATRKLKNLAMELDIPILLLTQLNRGLENRPNKRPVPSDTRDSGSIEQDADTLIFVYRDEVYNEDSPDKGICEVNFALARHHESKVIRLASQLQYQRFVDIARQGGWND